jgi:large subunit ribosomal protein L10
MVNNEKVEKVRALAERFRSAQGTLFSDFRGLTVKDAMELREELRRHEASFVVAKNTLTKLAAKEAGLEGVDDILQGPTGIVFADGDPIAGAKAFVEVARRFPALQLKGAYVEGHVFDEEAAKALATVDAKEVSLAKIAGLLRSPLSRIAYVLQAPVQRLAYALAERGQQPGGGATPEGSAGIGNGTAEPGCGAVGDPAPAAAASTVADDEAPAVAADGPADDDEGPPAAVRGNAGE